MDVRPPYPDTPEDWEDRLEAAFSRCSHLKLIREIMYWSDDNDKSPEFRVSDDVVDLAFRIDCPTLPLDHAHALSSALQQQLPWLQEEAHAVCI